MTIFVIVNPNLYVFISKLKYKLFKYKNDKSIFKFDKISIWIDENSNHENFIHE